jgi:phage terminase large subunit GpA-like protein
MMRAAIRYVKQRTLERILSMKRAKTARKAAARTLAATDYGSELERAEDAQIEQLVVECLAALQPPSKITLSQWADAYRVLSSESSAEHGAWVTANAPYEREIMDAISDTSVPRVVVQKAAQLGITDAAILNTIGFHITEDPCPILVVQPTVEIAEAFSTDRLAPMLRDTPALRGKVGDPKSRDSQNTLRRKAFPGGYVAMGGANSAASLSGRPVRVVLLDDVDRYPPSAGTEGNPLQLAIARASAFWNRKIVIVSSPGIAGISHVEREMALTTCEFWYLPCPACGVAQILEWDRIDFDTLTHRCLSCAERFEKFEWLAGEGEWRAHRPVDERGKKVMARGFYVGGLVNPWVEWDILRDEFVLACKAKEEGDIELLKAFRNTRLGLLHQDEGSKIKVDLYERRELYEHEVPDGVRVITAGVDVQEQSLHADVIGWGKGRENWHLDYITIPGDPRTIEAWDALDEAVFDRVFLTSDGKFMRVRRMCVDSNYASDYVYAYTKPRQPRCIAIRGMGGLGKAPIAALTLSKSNRCLIASLGVDTLKEEIMNRLNVTKPGPGYCHFPRSDVWDEQLKTFEPARGYDVSYFEGLRAEQRVMKSKHGFKTYVWVKRLSQRNESWDDFVYGLAALQLPHSGIRLDVMERDAFNPPDKTQPTAPARFGVQRGSGVTVAAAPAQPQQSTGKAKFGAVNRALS